MKISNLLQPKKIICFTFCVVFVMAIFVFYQRWSGLDITPANTNELDKINQTLYLVYMGVSFFFALFFLSFGLNRKENTKRQDTFLQVGIISALFFFIALMTTNYFLIQSFS
ncbi:hypothetical protein Fleli_0796 [Bernardetia litoralis DSM 6794]|uniref:Uncharacterized protein n=1 Tax=Bernardetia litoralis (strain ATCC 23117 / DSM 6794 / NBRC 15988 / NCIMB 1366 / Fx l1 / Sio-4) TaxID=880071 RepID=I4AH20_BERLS|nr:hypothetical protein [Bernardetia litoralis]AFM03255.1 hypothetical protein Fleli_0796 [Bernardetia litoralis DSM 6794]